MSSTGQGFPPPAELDANLPGGAGADLHSLIDKWSALQQDGSRVAISGSNTNDYAAVNLGQVKKLFSFDVAFKTDPNNPLPDWWQMKYFGQIGVHPAADPDGDGVTNADEFLQGTNPVQSLDSNNNGLPDDWELFHANSFAAWPAPVSMQLSFQQSGTNNLTQGFNYSFLDSKTGGVPFAWEDISTTGTQLTGGLATDDGSEPVTLSGFAFPFYGQSFSTVNVCSNGMLTFGNNYTEWNNTSLPNSYAPPNMIAALWDDLTLDPSCGGSVYYKEESGRLIVQYQNVPALDGYGTYTFQVVLSSDGTIDLRYRTISGDSEFCTVGLQGTDGSDGIQVAYNQAYLKSHMAIWYGSNCCGLPLFVWFCGFDAAHKTSEQEDRTISQTLGASPAEPEDLLWDFRGILRTNQPYV